MLRLETIRCCAVLDFCILDMASLRASQWVQKQRMRANGSNFVKPY